MTTESFERTLSKFLVNIPDEPPTPTSFKLNFTGIDIKWQAPVHEIGQKCPQIGRGGNTLICHK